MGRGRLRMATSSSFRRITISLLCWIPEKLPQRIQSSKSSSISEPKRISESYYPCWLLDTSWLPFLLENKENLRSTVVRSMSLWRLELRYESTMFAGIMTSKELGKHMNERHFLGYNVVILFRHSLTSVIMYDYWLLNTGHLPSFNS